MKIAMITSTFLPRFIGGRETHVYSCSKALIDRGHEVHVFTGDHVKRYETQKYKGIMTHRFPMCRFALPAQQEDIPYRIVSPSLLSALDNFKPDIIHAHDYRHFTTDISAYYSKVKKKPFILTVHGFFYNPRSISRILMRSYDYFLGPISLRIASRIICVSRTLVKGPITLVKDKVSIIPNAISIGDIINGGFGPSRFREKVACTDSDRIILGLGRLTKQKGFKFLIQAYKKVAERFPDVKLVIVGPETKYGTKLKHSATCSNIIFTGAISSNLVKSAYLSASVFVSSSLDEGCPIAILEAMAFEKPIIATSVGLVPEIINQGVNGVLVEPGKPEQISKAIIDILSKESLAQILSQNAQRAVKMYDWSHVALEIEKVYKGCEIRCGEPM